jgi:hypothetical protein
MARSKHRRNHKEALAVHRIEAQIRVNREQAGKPQKVGKKKYEVAPDSDQVEGTIVEINGRECVVEVAAGSKTITLPPDVHPEKGDKIRISYPYKAKPRYFAAPEPKPLSGATVEQPDMSMGCTVDEPEATGCRAGMSESHVGITNFRQSSI